MWGDGAGWAVAGGHYFRAILRAAGRIELAAGLQGTLTADRSGRDWPTGPPQYGNTDWRRCDERDGMQQAGGDVVSGGGAGSVRGADAWSDNGDAAAGRASGKLADDWDGDGEFSGRP